MKTSAAANVSDKKKTRTIKYQMKLGLQVDCRQISKNYRELQVDYCVNGGQVRGVAGMVITRIGEEALFDKNGSFSVDVMVDKIEEYKAKKQNFKMTFNNKGFIKNHLKQEKLKASEERKKNAAKKKKESAEKKKLYEKQKKKAAVAHSKKSVTHGTRKLKTAAKKKSQNPMKKVPHKVILFDPSLTQEVGLQIEPIDKFVTVTKIHPGSVCKGVKGWVMFKIDNYQCFKNMDAVQKLLKQLLNPRGDMTPFNITFVKAENVTAMIAFEKLSPPEKTQTYQDNASSSSSSSSSSSGKRKATSSMTLNQMEKALKRYKSENDGLRTQVDMLQSYNAQLQKNNKELLSQVDEAHREPDGMAVWVSLKCGGGSCDGGGGGAWISVVYKSIKSQVSKVFDF